MKNAECRIKFFNSKFSILNSFVICGLFLFLGAAKTINHSDLFGLYSDDHPQYLKKDATRPLDADWNAGAFTITAAGIDVTDLDIGTLSLAAASITDSTGNIDFNDEDLQGIGSLSFGDFTSLVATGTAPFFCESTTVCGNLNADLLDGQHAAAFQAAGSYQTQDSGLTSLAGLAYASASFVKMTAADTFTLDTNTYYKSGDAPTFAAVLAQNIQPSTDNTYYIGKNDDDTPAAYKGIILKDTTNGKYYRIEIISGVITATDLTD